MAVYLVLNINRHGLLTLQNLNNPGSIFETVADNLESSGYFRISETPYINLGAKRSKTPKHRIKMIRCPRTVDLFAGRADSEGEPDTAEDDRPRLPHKLALPAGEDRPVLSLSKEGEG